MRAITLLCALVTVGALGVASCARESVAKPTAPKAGAQAAAPKPTAKSPFQSKVSISAGSTKGAAGTGPSTSVSVSTPAAPGTTPTAWKFMSVGDPAPSLAGLKTVRGESVGEFQTGTIYVIDFWATWCGPCLELFPETSALQEKYAKDKVRVIAVSIWEASRPLGNYASYAEKVAAFAQKNAGVMRFDVAYEGDDAAMAAAYMRAANRVSIPSVFVVGRDGKIAWVGHPSFGLASVLDRMVAGTFDAAAEEKVSHDREARRLKGMQLATKLQRHWQAGEYEDAVKTCDDILALDLEHQMFAPTTVSKFRLLLTDIKDAPRATEYARQAVRDYPGSPTVSIGIAGTILLAPDAPERSVPLANEMMGLAEPGSENTTSVGPAAFYLAVDRLERLIPLANEPVRSQLAADLKVYRDTKAKASAPAPEPKPESK